MAKPEQADQLAEAELDDFLVSVYADPLGHVMGSYPWETDPDIQLVELPPDLQERYGCKFGPDQWAIDFLVQWGKDIRASAFDGKHAVDPLSYAVASGHGIGKSVLAAWIVKFIMDTRPGSKGTVTATTADQLRTKTWAEVGKWHKRSLTAHRFEYKTGRGAMSLTSVSNPEGWFCTAQTCREENSEAFAGQHAANATSFYLFDEASGVPAKIFEVRRGGLTDGEPMTFDFGNPTRNSGAFYDEFHGRDALHYTRRWHIDSRTVKITNKKLHQTWIDTWGLESDFVKVRIRGIFPSQGGDQYIPTEDVDAAMARERPFVKGAALVMGVDVGGGGDLGDETVLKIREGMDARSYPARRYRGLDTVQITGKIIEVVHEFRAMGRQFQAIFIDGGGVGTGVGDQLRHLGYDPIVVYFGNSPVEGRTYFNLGDEMWGKLRDALHTALALPDMTTDEGKDLKDQLTGRLFGTTNRSDLIHMESKKSMKSRGLASPDLADALALTFAQDVAPVEMAAYRENPVVPISEYDPWSYNLGRE